jgi:hypothetical protein
VGDAWTSVFLDLKLEDQVDALGDKLLRVLDGDVRIVAVVEQDKLHAGTRSGGGYAFGYSDGKGHFGALDREAEAEPFGTGDEPVLAVLRLGDVAAMDQRLENAVDAGLGDFGFAVDVFKGDGHMVLLKQLKDVEGFGENGDQVEPFDLCFGHGFAFLEPQFRSVRTLNQDNSLQA